MRGRRERRGRQRPLDLVGTEGGREARRGLRRTGRQGDERDRDRPAFRRVEVAEAAAWLQRIGARRRFSDLEEHLAVRTEDGEAYEVLRPLDQP